MNYWPSMSQKPFNFDSKSKRCEKKMKAKSIQWWYKYEHFSFQVFLFVTSEAKLRASRFEGQSLLPPSSVVLNISISPLYKSCAPTGHDVRPQRMYTAPVVMFTLWSLPSSPGNPGGPYLPCCPGEPLPPGNVRQSKGECPH